MTKNKSDIALAVGQYFGTPIRDRNKSFKMAKKGINVILEQMSETLSNGGRVELRGFGSFRLKTYADGVICTRNPKTGEVRYKQRSPKVAFKAGKGLRRGINAKR